MSTEDQVDRAIQMLRDSWHDALRLVSARQAWQVLAPTLDGYDNASWMLFSWYRDHVLAGCRRLLDDRRDSRSLVRALRLIKGIAPRLTIERLSEEFTGDEYERDHRLHLAERIAQLAGVEPGTVQAVPKRVVQHDIDMLREQHDDVTRLASQMVAHRKAEPEELSVTFEDVDALLDDVLAVAQRWAGLLESVHLSLDAPEIHGVRPMAKALQLFDWEEFVEAVSHVREDLGPHAAPAAYRDLEDRVAVRFVTRE